MILVKTYLFCNLIIGTRYGPNLFFLSDIGKGSKNILGKYDACSLLPVDPN